MSSLQSKPVVLVTGAGRRVGSVIARTLAQAGYRLALHANRSSQGAEQLAGVVEAAAGQAFTIEADFRDEAAIRRMIDQAYEHFGRLDAVVNNAAIWQRKSLEATTAADVRAHWEVDSLAPFVVCQHAGLLMARQETGGAIVNIADWAISRPYPDYAAYFAAKGSIPTLTRTFAVELAKRNPQVRVNAILPGPVMLPAEMTAAERETVISATLVKRAGTPEHVAHAVRFLLENDFVTGVCLPVDGGRTIFGGAFEERGS